MSAVRALRAAAVVLATVMASTLVVVPRGEAHDPLTYFWPSGIPGASTVWPFPSMNVQFTPTFPNDQTWRDRVQEGHVNWPQSTGRPPVYFSVTGNNWPFQVPCAQPDNWNGIFLWDLDSINPGYAGVTYACTSYQHWNFTTTYDTTGRSWWIQNSSAPADFLDFESVTTHEFGHAYGWNGNHFSGTTLCPASSNHHTMCTATYIGTTWDRTPSTHDLDTITAAYPP